jgi:hypothetical protein
MSVVLKKLECCRCDVEAKTLWDENPSNQSLRPIDLLPSFYERVRLSNNRSCTEIACSNCERTVYWPRRSMPKIKP